MSLRSNKHLIMKLQAAINLDFNPRQLIGCREVAALLGVSERTLRAGADYRPLLARSFWLGKFRKWQAGFVYEWIAQQQREAIQQAEAAEQRQQELCKAISIERPRQQATSVSKNFYAELQARNAEREKRFARRGQPKKPRPKRILL